MAQLLAPLANITEDSNDFTDFTVANGNFDSNFNVRDEDEEEINCNHLQEPQSSSPLHQMESDLEFDESLFPESTSGSLEDLVNTFDAKITKCFRNYNEQTDTLAPVQVRSQDEILSESPLWSTLVNNCGNILPIEWSKSRARELQLRGLNLHHPKLDGTFKISTGNFNDSICEFNFDEDEIAKDLDLHSLVSSTSYSDEPIVTAEQVLQEIDQIMHENSGPDSCLGSCNSTADSSPSTESASHPLDMERAKLPLFTRQRLCSFTIGQLSELLVDLEKFIQSYSEILIQQLALRDELEYEKELKNSFISLVLGVQSKRRQVHSEKKKMAKQSSDSICTNNSAKYLTTVIPYHGESGPPNVHSLQVLIKILRAINEDSPTVPTLLTDYILKVICPT